MLCGPARLRLGYWPPWEERGEPQSAPAGHTWRCSRVVFEACLRPEHQGRLLSLEGHGEEGSSLGSVPRELFCVLSQRATLTEALQAEPRVSWCG